MTIAVLTLVEGTSNSSTMPPMDTGSAATLKDMSTWARKSPTMGTQEALPVVASTRVSGLVRGVVLRGGGCSGCEDVEAEGAREVRGDTLGPHGVARSVQAGGEGGDPGLPG